MTRVGKGASGGALTVVNAIPFGKGAAIGLDLEVKARVELETESGPVELQARENPEVDADLATACIEVLSDSMDTPLSGRVETESQIPPARGLKSSSAVANAIVAAGLDAFGEPGDPDRILDLSVQAARRADVTVTGALDDAAASLLGGLVVTDNERDEILGRKRLGPSLPVLVLVPETERHTRTVGSLEDAESVVQHAWNHLDDWETALTLNGLGIAAALDAPLDPVYRALTAGARAAGLSGTGPAVAAVLEEPDTSSVRQAWQPYTTGILATRTRDGEVQA